MMIKHYDNKKEPYYRTTITHDHQTLDDVGCHDGWLDITYT
jgi:hypothetical protein